MPSLQRVPTSPPRTGHESRRRDPADQHVLPWRRNRGPAAPSDLRGRGRDRHTYLDGERQHVASND